MNDQSSTPGVSSTNDPLSPQKPALSADALVRRRLMLRGATGGAAALAALQPIGALATSGQSTVLTCLNADGKESLCTLSGVNSAAHSFGPTVVKVQAKGKAPAYWKDRPTSWPAACSTTCNTGTTVKTLLTGCNYTYRNKSVLWILQNQVGLQEADFITAYLNAAAYHAPTNPTAALSFPYSKEKVLEFWQAGGATRDSARRLFKAISTSTA